MCDVMCGVLNRSLSGVPYHPFYRLRESRDYRWEKEEKLEAKEVLQSYRVLFFLYASPADMAGGARASAGLGFLLSPMACPRDGDSPFAEVRPFAGVVVSFDGCLAGQFDWGPGILFVGIWPG